LDEWWAAIKINGAADGEYARKDREIREKEEEKR
jgi:hypothetical protein